MNEDVRSGQPDDEPVDRATAATPPVEWRPPARAGSDGDRPPSAAQRTTDAVVWVLGIVAVLFLGRVTLLFSPSSGLSAFEQGQIVGRIAGAILTGVVVRWVWVKLRKRGRVLSPWILVVAALLLVSALSRA